MGLRILYLTAIPSAYNDQAFTGAKLAEQLPGDGGDLLVRHWLTDSRDEAIARNRGLAADATDRAEFTAFAPDVVFMEGGLYSGHEDWRIPPDVAVSFVENGGVLIVADVDLQAMRSHPSYQGDLRFFGAQLDGQPEDLALIRYVRDEQTNDGDPASVLCPWPSNDWGWRKDAYDGIDLVLAVSPVALEPRGSVLLWSAPTAGVLSQDYFVDLGRTTPLATVAQHGLGYAAVIAAAVSDDMVTSRHPGNIRWLCNLASIMHERAARGARLRQARPAKAPRTGTGPYGGRPAAELAALPEDRFLEHKQTFAWDIRTKQKSKELSDGVLDRVCSFWNTDGGTLLVGVEDRTGNLVGLDPDLKLFKDRDGLINAISQRLHDEVPAAAPSIEVRIEEVDGTPVLRIDVAPGSAPVFRQDEFFVRENNTTRKLKGEPLQAYLRHHWPDDRGRL